MVAFTLLHRKGYLVQHLDLDGRQSESAAAWRPDEKLEPMAPTVTVEIEGRQVKVRAWRYAVRGVTGHVVPVYLLDTALPENGEYDRTLTDCLYGGDSRYRLCQEVVLGVGGLAMLRALAPGDGVRDGVRDGRCCCHINEGHAALLTLSLLEQQLAGRTVWDIGETDLEAVRRRCIFTTHTPVPAGHDKFPLDLARQVLGAERVSLLEAVRAVDHGELNMTVLALRFARFVNAVARRHQDVSREMFPDYDIGSITNGVHAVTWTSEPFRQLFDREIPNWRVDNLYLRYATTISLDDIRDAHARAKQSLLDEVARRTGTQLDPKVMTIGFARRSTQYKRADLIFSDLERLRRIARRIGPMQIVFGGKAHPHDASGKELIQKIFRAARALDGALRVVYLENYELDLGALMTSGVDLWLNNPLRPLEASGTSGMKAALNGVPSLSVLDGWWIEGHGEGVTGWAIGHDDILPVEPSKDIASLYQQLEKVILPLFYGLPYKYAEVMRNAIALNGSFFNTQRMVQQYMRNAYFPAGPAPTAAEEMVAG
jgi:starch phosphorylase